MPNVFHVGHFAVVSSVAVKPQWTYGVKRIALLEVYPELVKNIQDKHDPYYEYANLKIDPRLKAIKHIVFRSPKIYTHTRQGYWMHRRLFQSWMELSKRWEQLWPLHVLAKGWPWPDMMEMG